MDAIERRAEEQHGAISREQAAAMLSKAAIRHRVDSGRWVELANGVFVVRGAPPTVRQQISVAVLSCGPQAAASHATAAWLHQIPGFSPEPVNVLIDHGRRLEEREWVVRRSRSVPDSQLTVVDGIRVTTVARTLFDICATSHPKRAERALDNALARRLVGVERMNLALGDLGRRGRAGTKVLRELLATRPPDYVPPANDLEGAFVDLCRARGWPVADRQVDLGDEIGWIGRIDFVWRDLRLVVELDGRDTHTGKLDREADARRDARLTAAGWTVVRLGWDDVVTHPSRAAARLEPFWGAKAS
jgi:hypothetical protein